MATPSIPDGGQSPFDSIREIDEHGREFWRARRLQPLMGYPRWQDFQRVIERAMAAAHNTGASVPEVFRGSPENPTGRGGRPRADFILTRFAAYLAAMNGDPNKEEVAAAQAYFAGKTREAELNASRDREQLEAMRRVVALQDKVLALTVVNNDLTRRVGEMEQKAEGYDDLIAAEGCFDMSAVAKILSPATGNIGRTRLLNLLRGMGIILQGSTLPEQKYIERGYFQVRTDIVNGKAVASTVATPKGLRWLQFELREDRPTLNHPARPAELPSAPVLKLPRQLRGGEAS